MATLSTILMAFGLSASAGLNAYIPLLVIAIGARLFPEAIQLGEPYRLLASDVSIGALAVLLVIEVLADKVPIVDHVNDFVGLFIRPTAGALLFAASTGAVTSLEPSLALILGFVIAGATHGAKATARPIVTATTGGLGNPVVSTLEDIAALVTSLVAVVAPLLVGLALVIFGGLFVWWRARRPARPPSASGPTAGTPALGSAPGPPTA